MRTFLFTSPRCARLAAGGVLQCVDSVMKGKYFWSIDGIDL